MPLPQEMLVELKRRAQIHVDTAKKVSGLDFDFSEASIDLFDPMIEQNWEGNVPTQLDAMVKIMGAYLGEVIVRYLNGEWVEQMVVCVLSFHFRMDQRRMRMCSKKCTSDLRMGWRIRLGTIFSV